MCPPEPGPAPDITTDDVRERYMHGVEEKLWGLGSHTLGDYEAAFDRWLAAHDSGDGGEGAAAMTRCANWRGGVALAPAC